ncbi:MAG: hypothetical protein J5U17_03950 [Candidatus Methanoperedens sp.]|nr:hypothetical protein [Candidatus Methanoperedens sp.]
MNKLFAAVIKDDIGKVISALADTGVCHFIERPGSGLELSRHKALIAMVERRVDEVLFNLPGIEAEIIEIEIANDVDMTLCELAEDVATCVEKETCKFIDIKKKLRYLKSVYSILEFCNETTQTYTFEAWVPERKQELINATIDEASNGANVVYFSSPDFGEVPPSLLSNPGTMKPFEVLVKMYGLPSYYEIDPTSILFVTFPLIFGIMYGDVAHGILLFLLSIALFKSEKKVRKGLTLRDFSPILMMCAIFSMFFGFMYGEFSGIKFPPLWLSPDENIAYFLILSLWTGVLHLVLGLIMNAINLFKNKKFMRALFQMQWIIFSASSFFFYVNFFYLESNEKIRSFLFLLILPGICMVTGGILINSIERKGALRGIMVPVYLGLEYAVHLMSYMRLIIMALAHSTISATIVALGRNSAISLIIAGLITFFLIILVETFLVFIQTLRLHWVEWFYLFYKGKGTEFRPFKLA